jgi:hypothetical protein
MKASVPAQWAPKFSARYRSRILALFLWRRLPVFDLAGGDIDYQLSELIGVARAFLAFRPDGHLRVFLSLEVSFLPYLES